MSFSEWIVRHVSYPVHEWLCRRPTLRELHVLRRLAGRPVAVVERDADQRLRTLLRFAAAHLPYYAERFARAGIDPDAPDPRAAVLKLPVLSKADVRAAGDRLLNQDVPGGPVLCRTGGTTGHALHFHMDRVQQAQRMAARLFMQELFGVRPGDRRVYVWGSPIESTRSRLQRLRDRLINEILLDAFDLSPQRVAGHLARLRALRPRVIYGYPSAVALLAKHISSMVGSLCRSDDQTADGTSAATFGRPARRPAATFGRPARRPAATFGRPARGSAATVQTGGVRSRKACPPSNSGAGAARGRYVGRDQPRGRCSWLRLIVLTGEEVLDEQRAQIEAAFGCPVAVEYGSREMGLIAHECPRGGLHILTPHVFLEVLCDGRPAGPGECGEIVGTTLGARAQPLIRYRLEDAGRLLPDGCECGLPFPLLRLEGGKITGFLALPGGRLCHGAVSSYVLRDEAGIIQFKTYQRQIGRIEVLLVVDQGFSPESIERIRQNYRRLIGPGVRVDCRIVDHIPPDPSGKRRHFVSQVAPDEPHFEIVHPPGFDGHGSGRPPARPWS